MEFPAPPRNALEQSSAVLMLGAGASLGAKNEFVHTMPGVKELTRLLAVRFLDSSYATAPVTQVAPARSILESEGRLWRGTSFVPAVVSSD